MAQYSLICVCIHVYLYIYISIYQNLHQPTQILIWYKNCMQMTFVYFLHLLQEKHGLVGLSCTSIRKCTCSFFSFQFTDEMVGERRVYWPNHVSLNRQNREIFDYSLTGSKSETCCKPSANETLCFGCCVYACTLDPIMQGTFESPQLLGINQSIEQQNHAGLGALCVNTPASNVALKVFRCSNSYKSV